jgi:hypothetical protein
MEKMHKALHTNDDKLEKSVTGILISPNVLDANTTLKQMDL